MLRYYDVLTFLFSFYHNIYRLKGQSRFAIKTVQYFCRLSNNILLQKDMSSTTTTTTTTSTKLAFTTDVPLKVINSRNKTWNRRQCEKKRTNTSNTTTNDSNKRRRTNQHDTEILLDPSKPEEARRMQQRKRMIEKGKNTIGYTEYLKQIPKEQRKPKSMDHPSTPNYKANIPNRRWLGLVSAWYVQHAILCVEQV